jgi:antitoxin MazE
MPTGGAGGAYVVYSMYIHGRVLQMRSRISKWGNSLAIRLPRNLVAELGLADGDAVELFAENGRLVIAPISREYGLEELADKITPDNRHTETDWGPPQGAESW